MTGRSRVAGIFARQRSSMLTDRRLAYYNLEIRDGYFSRLKAKIEQYRRHNGKKVVICSHS
jgi:hypothetical protein